MNPVGFLFDFLLLTLVLFTTTELFVYLMKR